MDLLNVSLNGEAYNASHFPNDDAVGLLDSEDPERKTVRLCYGTDPELFVIQVIDNLIKTDGNEPLRAWLNGLPGKTPALTCSLNGLYTSKDSRDQVVHVDFPSDRKSKYLTILFNFECNTDVEGKVGTLTSQKSTVFVDDKRENAVSFSAEGVAFDGNEPLRAWLNGLPGKTPALTCSLNGLYTSQDSRDQGVHVDFPSDRKSKYLTILFNFVCNTDVEGKVGTLTSQKSTVFVEAAGGSKRKQGGADQDSQTLGMAEAEGVAFDGNEKHYGCGSFERLALLVVLNASSRTDENLDTKIAHEMKCNWFKDTQQLSRDRTSAGGVMGKEALVRKMLMPYVTGVGSGRERFKWPRRFCKECLR